jgi:outer membrane receptor protein involved in Fe transport
MNITKFPRIQATALIILGLPALLGAQTSPSAPPKDALPDYDDIVQMSAFEVSAKSSNGYLASEAASGTRYATPIMETPISAQVLTSEFINDFNAFDLTGQEMLSYTSSFSPADGTGAINLRGIRGFAVYKNGIREGGVLGPASIDRTEIIRGAASSIYGQSEPSGMINRITKKGQPRPFQELRLNIGEDSLSRVQVDVNQPLVPGEVLSRFAASQEYSRFGPQDFANFKRTNLYGSVTWTITPKTTFNVNTEYIWFRSYTQSAATMPWVYVPVSINNSAAVNQMTGIFGRNEYEEYGNININGPKTFNQLEYTQIDGTFSHKFTNWLSAQLKGAYWNRVQNQMTNRNTGVNGYNSTTNALTGYTTPSIVRNRGSKSVAQLDILAQFKTGPVTHKMLLTGDYGSEDAYNSQRYANITTTQLQVNNFLIGGPFTISGFNYDAAYHDNSLWVNNQTNTRSRTVTKGIMFSDRLGFFKDRWLLLVGGRHDQLNRSLVDRLNAIMGVQPGDVYSQPVDMRWTYQTGTVVRVKKTISIFGNYSSSFLPQDNSRIANRDIHGIPLPAQKGTGGEAGAKFDLFGNKLTFTMGGYNIVRENVLRPVRDDNNTAINSPYTGNNYSESATVRTKGLELDGSWRPAREITTTFALGYNRIKYVSVPNKSEQYLVDGGVRPDTGPEWTGSVTAGYKFFTGWLKGFNARMAVRYQGRSLINNSTSSIYGNSSAKGRPVRIGAETYDTYFFESKGYVRLDMYLGYGWDQRSGGGKKINHSITAGLTNMLDAKYLINQRPGDPVTFNISYVLKH